MTVRLLLPVVAFSAFVLHGEQVSPVGELQAASSYLIAENAFMLRWRAPNGEGGRLVSDLHELDKFYGTPPWVAQRMPDGQYRVLTNPAWSGPRTGFIYRQGRLRRMVVGDSDQVFTGETPPPVIAEDLPSLWPEGVPKTFVHDIWGQSGRLTLGYANPNKAGALLAEICMAGLCLLLVRGWLWRSIGLIVAALGFWGVVLSASRGAVVAVALSFLVVVLSRIREFFTWRRLACVAVGAACLFGGLYLSGDLERYTTRIVNTQGEGDATRLKIWREAPRMMVDAPTGWGLGQAGRAFDCWYQQVCDIRVVRTLINSHLTFLVELGWPLRLIYLMLLFGGFAILFAVSTRGGSAMPLGIWVAFMLTGFFNSTLESPTLWTIPVLSLAALAFHHVRMEARVCRRIAVGALCLSGAVLLGFLIAGRVCSDSPSIRADGRRVRINGDDPAIWIVDDKQMLGGGFIGREMRIFYRKNPSAAPVGRVCACSDLPRTFRRLVVAGKCCTEFLDWWKNDRAKIPDFTELIFMSPPFAASSVPLELLTQYKVRVIQGDFAARLTPDFQSPPPWLRIVPGAAIYIPGWMSIVQHEFN